MFNNIINLDKTPYFGEQKRDLMYQSEVFLYSDTSKPTMSTNSIRHREGGAGFVDAGVLERDGERAVAAHAVARDRGVARVHGEVLADDARQLLGDVVVHVEVRAPRLLRGIDVEASACTSAPATQLKQRHGGWRGRGADAPLPKSQPSSSNPAPLLKS